MTFLYNKEGHLQPNIRDIIHDQNQRQEQKTLLAFIEKQGGTLSEAERCCKDFEKALFDQVHFLGHLIFHRAQLSGQWGDVGKDQMRVSFCRNLLAIPPESEITYEQSQSFETKVEENLNILQLKGKTEDELEQLFDDFKFSLFGKDYDIHDIVQINEILTFLGSSFFIQGGYYGYEKEVIFGEGHSRHMGDYDVIYFEKEHRRTPNTVTSMAAVIGDKQIFIRKESLITIFYQKWVSFIQHGEWSHFFRPDDLAYGLSDAIKKRVLSGFSVKTSEVLCSKQDRFISDMGETILHHELGHGIIQYHILPLQAATLAEATKVCGETIVIALLEILADIAPLYEDTQGPLMNMALISQQDPERAKRMFDLYLSDVWFYDTDDTYMYLYADLITPIMVAHMSEDEINFDSLSKQLTISDDFKTKTIQDQTILEWAVHNVIKITQDIEAIAQQATYKLEKEEALSFDALKSHIDQELNSSEIDPETYMYNTAVWAEVLDKLLKNSDSEAQLRQCLKAHEERVLEELFMICTGNKKETEKKETENSAENATVRDYVFAHLKDIFLSGNG